MATDKVRIGLLGCGGIVGAHMRGYERVRDTIEVIAVAEPRVERHEQVRKWFGDAVPILDSYEDVLAIDAVEAVDIVLPHDLHMKATVAAAEAGKHVLIEKVMARNVYECDRMIEACATNGVTLTVCHDRRYHGEWETVKQILDTGALGEIFFFKLDHNQNVLPPAGHWIRTKDGIGGGAIMSCLTHQIDALRWYGGEVESVNCMSRTIPERMEGEFLGLVQARMRSGALAELSINWWTSSNIGDNSLWYEMVQVCGSHGEAYRVSGKGTFVRLHEGATDDAIARYGEAALDRFVQVPSAEYTGHEKCIIEWSKLLSGSPADIRTDGTICRGTVEVAEAAYLSESEGRTITLPIEPRPWVNQSDPEMIKRQTGSQSNRVTMDRDNPLSERA